MDIDDCAVQFSIAALLGMQAYAPNSQNSMSRSQFNCQ
jgi:hypothetical protein